MSIESDRQAQHLLIIPALLLHQVGQTDYNGLPAPIALQHPQYGVDPIKAPEVLDGESAHKIGHDLDDPIAAIENITVPRLEVFLQEKGEGFLPERVESLSKILVFVGQQSDCLL